MFKDTLQYAGIGPIKWKVFEETISIFVAKLRLCDGH